MNPVDYAIIAVILLIIGAAAFFIYRSRKSGKKCIGCPDSGTCGNCSGNCNGGCGCGCGDK